jgi:hypothetical protein
MPFSGGGLGSSGGQGGEDAFNWGWGEIFEDIPQWTSAIKMSEGPWIERNSGNSRMRCGIPPGNRVALNHRVLRRH